MSRLNRERFDTQVSDNRYFTVPHYTSSYYYPRPSDQAVIETLNIALCWREANGKRPRLNGLYLEVKPDLDSTHILLYRLVFD